MSNKLDLELEAGEEILFSETGSILTNYRLCVGLDRKKPSLLTHEARLGDISSYKQMNGGRESRRKDGLLLFFSGLALIVVQVLGAPIIPSAVDAILFLGCALLFLLSFYFLVNSVLRVKPHTLVLFTIWGSRDIPAYFPGQNNPAANELVRLYTRARRRLST